MCNGNSSQRIKGRNNKLKFVTEPGKIATRGISRKHPFSSEDRCEMRGARGQVAGFDSSSRGFAFYVVATVQHHDKNSKKYEEEMAIERSHAPHKP